MGEKKPYRVTQPTTSYWPGAVVMLDEDQVREHHEPMLDIQAAVVRAATTFEATVAEIMTAFRTQLAQDVAEFKAQIEDLKALPAPEQGMVTIPGGMVVPPIKQEAEGEIMEPEPPVEPQLLEHFEPEPVTLEHETWPPPLERRGPDVDGATAEQAREDADRKAFDDAKAAERAEAQQEAARQEAERGRLAAEEVERKRRADAALDHDDH